MEINARFNCFTSLHIQVTRDAIDGDFSLSFTRSKYNNFLHGNHEFWLQFEGCIIL